MPSCCPPLKTCLVLPMAILLAACSGDPKPPPPLAFEVSADTQVNHGALFYLVVRNVNEKQFMLDSYQDVAGKAFSDPPDPNGLGVFSIVPGTRQECLVSPPAQGMIALYFLLTQPASQWKKLLSLPLADRYNINLTATGQVDIAVAKPWYSWF